MSSDDYQDWWIPNWKITKGKRAMDNIYSKTSNKIIKEEKDLSQPHIPDEEVRMAPNWKMLVPISNKIWMENYHDIDGMSENISKRSSFSFYQLPYRYGFLHSILYPKGYTERSKKEKLKTKDRKVKRFFNMEFHEKNDFVQKPARQDLRNKVFTKFIKYPKNLAIKSPQRQQAWLNKVVEKLEQKQRIKNRLLYFL